MTRPLSPAAQAVEAAILKVASVPGFERRRIIAAAALRAATDQVIRVQVYMTQEERSIRDYLFAIAAELEGEP
jgi:hypothetical protein